MTWPTGAHANTFGGNPLACAAGLRAIELIEEGTLAHVRRMGEHLAEQLRSLMARFPHLGSPHGLGLLQAVDILRGSNGSLDSERRNRIVQAAFERGLLLLGCGEGSIRFLPPLNVTAEEIDAAVTVFARALEKA